MLRPVLPQDVSTLARALLAVPQSERARLCRRILKMAALARDHMHQTGRLHPVWGDGSLDAAARRHDLQPEPFWDDPDYLSCLILALRALRRRCVTAAK